MISDTQRALAHVIRGPLAICDGAEIWLADPGAVLRTGLQPELEALLSSDERTQQGAFVFERDRAQYLVAHALLRSVLSRHAPVSPIEWLFVRNDFGRPQIANECPVPLQFSLSHADGLVAVAIAVGHSVGIDVETTQRVVETLVLADRYFAPAEASVLRSLTPFRRNDAFFDYWTLKEAYAKARGMGMSLPFHAFAFDLSVDGPPRISFSPELADDPDDWRFALWSPTNHHRLAVAVCLRHS